MTFGEAMVALEAGKQVRRHSWEDMSEQVVRVTTASGRPSYILVADVSDGSVCSYQWSPAAHELHATDWEVIE